MVQVIKVSAPTTKSYKHAPFYLVMISYVRSSYL